MWSSIKCLWDQRAIIILLFRSVYFRVHWMAADNCIYSTHTHTHTLRNCLCQGGVIKCGHINLQTARPTQFIVFILSKMLFFLYSYSPGHIWPDTGVFCAIPSLYLHIIYLIYVRLWTIFLWKFFFFSSLFCQSVSILG